MQLKIQSQYLKQLLRTHSIKIAPPDKPFKLASGGESLVFCDVKQTILQPEGARAAAEMLLERIHDFEQEHEMVIDAVAGVVLGGCAIASAVSNFGLVLGRRLSVLYVRKEPKENALCSSFEFTTWRDDRAWSQCYEGGRPVTEFADNGPAEGVHGTQFFFTLDASLLPNTLPTEADLEALAAELRGDGLRIDVSFAR